MADESQKTLRFPPFHIPAGVDIVCHGDAVVPLEPRAVRVLRYLAERSDRVVTKEELLDAVWSDVFTTDAVLKSAVLKIRRALGDGEGGARWIETHHKRGYRFVGEVEADPAAPPPAPTNFPHPLTRFVGREREVAAVRGLLADARLVTLTGPGGIGKTRLALETAAALREGFADGVWLVDLSSVADPALVPQAAASALGVREQKDRPVLDSLRAWLGDKRVVVVLDNCEHLVEACAHLAAAVLRAAGGVRVLATSREALAVAGEAVWPVPALGLPAADATALEATRDAEAVRLFVDRARLSDPTFELTRENAGAVAEVCRGLEGIPLAIELAAARVRGLPIHEIAGHLGDRFRLLTVADRTAPTRQQTLRGAVDWSYELLSDGERALLRRLSVFAGGWTLEAAEAVVGGQWSVASSPADGGRDSSTSAGDLATDHSPLTTLDLLSRLVDKSLVTADVQGGEARYRMLETIRAYAAEKLRESGEEAAVLAAYRTWCVGLAERLWGDARGMIDDARLGETVAEHDNFSAALSSGFEPGGDAEAAARIAVALGLFWQVRGHWTEGRRWFDAALAARPLVSPPIRAGALFWAGVLAQEQGELELARTRLEECLALRREEGNTKSTVSTLHVLGYVLEHMGDDGGATAIREECLALARAADDVTGVAVTAVGLGLGAANRGDYERAAAWFAEALAAFRSLGDQGNTSVALHNLGDIELRRGDPERAAELLEESLTVARAIDARRVIARSAQVLGNVANELGQHERALALLREALAIDDEHGNREGVALVLEGLAHTAGARGDAARALRLAGAADALRESIGAPIQPFEREALARALAPARRALGDEAADAAFREGRAMPLERAVAYAREPEPP